MVYRFQILLNLGVPEKPIEARSAETLDLTRNLRSEGLSLETSLLV